CLRRQNATGAPSEQDHFTQRADGQDRAKEIDNRGVFARLVLVEELLQASLRPGGSVCGQAGAEVIAEGAFLGDVVEQLLIVNLPAELAANAAGNSAAARSGLTADGNSQGRRHGGDAGTLAAVALEAMQRRPSFVAWRSGIQGGVSG